LLNPLVSYDVLSSVEILRDILSCFNLLSFSLDAFSGKTGGLKKNWVVKYLAEKELFLSILL